MNKDREHGVDSRRPLYVAFRGVRLGSLENPRTKNNRWSPFDFDWPLSGQSPLRAGFRLPRSSRSVAQDDIAKSRVFISFGGSKVHQDSGQARKSCPVAKLPPEGLFYGLESEFDVPDWESSATANFLTRFLTNRRSIRNFCESFRVYAHREQTINSTILCCRMFKLRRRLSARTQPGVAI